MWVYVGFLQVSILPGPAKHYVTYLLDQIIYLFIYLPSFWLLYDNLHCTLVQEIQIFNVNISYLGQFTRKFCIIYLIYISYKNTLFLNC